MTNLLEGKRVLVDTSYDYHRLSSYMDMWGLVPISDAYDPIVPLLERYQDSNANLALYGVLLSGDQDRILELPSEILRTFVIAKNTFALPEIYTEIDRLNLESVYENDVRMLDHLKSAFLRILGTKSK